jgi:hypothetical protein
LVARQYPNLNESGTLHELAVAPGYSQPLDPIAQRSPECWERRFLPVSRW